MLTGWESIISLVIAFLLIYYIFQKLKPKEMAEMGKGIGMFMRYLKKATRGEFDDEEIEREIEEGKKEELLKIARELGLDVEKLRDKPVEEIRRAVRERLRK